MPRWEVGSEERLKKATMELFAEQGVEATSVVEIAKRAGVTTRTFFRYFPDKRDVLFADAESLLEALVGRILEADVSRPFPAVIEVLAGFDWSAMGWQSQRRRHAIIAANPELHERDLMKRDAIASAFTGALRQRGVEAGTAQLASRVGSQVFFTAYEKWLTAEDETSLASVIEATLECFDALVAIRSAYST
ncbi:TetR family transcriptional regulator [Actinoplanes sp. NBRC 101535]|uniref:TetR family transcriptional regulator n=1 Tax=Actinoplanes sp. NBRC 101535 TaxID=3032196 RepID=UPI00249FE887|nr:TetR family transcriptional regulator [Actinoplanes sp. NBRC 101535]GLY03800.1 TetR family transcriptional regulator [Actinoplanes sp. NBRC 101535]